MEPIFEKDIAEHSYGFRPNRSCKDALRRVDGQLKTGYHWVVDVDLKSYFDTIPKDKLMSQLREKISDGKVLSLIQAYLDQEILDGMERWTPEAGTPRSAVASPLMANAYLDPLDHYMAQQGFEMTRYCDDFVVMCRSKREALLALDTIRECTEQAALMLHPTKTRVINIHDSEGFDFLGYRFQIDKKHSRGLIRQPRDKSLGKFRDKVRTLTKRNNGHSMSTIVAKLNAVIRGFFEYFKQCHQWTFQTLDGWIRMRLRSILRRRKHRKGRGRGNDHQRWPNAYFRDLGLLFMAEAWASLYQSLYG